MSQGEIMWLLLGNKSKARRVDGGREADLRCDECERVTRFVECDIKDKVSVFFVELGSMSSRRMVCTECGEDVEMDTAAPPPTASLPVVTRQPISEKDIDKKLKELKKKMGQ